MAVISCYSHVPRSVMQPTDSGIIRSGFEGSPTPQGECLDMGQEKSQNGQFDETELERLRQEHRELDEAITEIESQLYRSVADQTEIRRLKKLKLQKKDAMHFLMRSRASA